MQERLAIDLPASVRAVVFYDGVCGLCDRTVQFLLPRDRADRLRFATLQGDLAAAALGRRLSMETIVVWFPSNDQMLERSEAALALGRMLPAPWSVLARLAAVVPRPVRNAVYDWVARNRYGWFGRYDACPLPDPATRHKFLD
jgi:predicted DCC family thiol-disulfide oxidoreductase YuxK